MNREDSRKNIEPAEQQTAMDTIPGDDDPIREEEIFYSVEGYCEEHPDKEPYGPLYDRGSGRGQKENLEARKPFLLDECKRRGIRTPIYFKEVENGQSTLDQLHKRQKLIEAVKYAYKANMPLFVPSVNRLLRTFGKKDDPLTWGDIRRLEEFFMKHIGVSWIPIVSLVNPGTPPKKVKSWLIKLGQDAKGNKGGRGNTVKPVKVKLPSPVDMKEKTPSQPGEIRQRREKFLPIAKKLDEKGLSTRKISKKIMLDYGEYVSHSTVWVGRNEMKSLVSKSRKCPNFEGKRSVRF